MAGPRGDLASVSTMCALALVVMSELSVAAVQGDRAQDEIVLAQLQQVLAKAWVNGDRATIERIIAPEWRSIGPDGRASDRATVLADVFEKGVHRIRRVEIDKVLVRVFGDAAVVTGRTHGVGDFSGAPYDVIVRFTDTFPELVDLVDD